ncbi:MAG: asparagine synthase (glutamine-hydrolyzing) [Thermoguttaceae bacterium]
MCGITGVAWSVDGCGVSSETLDRMTDTLAHRGPDGRGTLWQGERGIALGHRRLAIIDTSPLGKQPLANSDGSVVIVFNGEVYNYRELRERLRSRYTFRSETDTEVVVHLYEEFGDDFLTHLNGMFALAIWDARRERLVVARDRIGKKPLYYTEVGETLIFGSELKSLLASGLFTPQIDVAALDLFLTYQYIPHPKTISKNVHKLPPACVGVWSRKSPQLDVRRYWQLDTASEDRRSDGEWCEELRSVVTDAVRLRMRSDVPIGAFLSGGIDSTITTGVMQSLATSPVETFSIGFAEQEYDETPHAQLVAERLGTIHHSHVVAPPTLDTVEKIVAQYDEPFADGSMIPTWFLCEHTRNRVTVALSGDGGDELFAGYQRYRAMRFGEAIDLFPHCFRRFLAGPFRSVIPDSLRQHSFCRQLRRLLEAMSMEPSERYLQWVSLFNKSRREQLYTDDAASALRDVVIASPDDATLLDDAFLRRVAETIPRDVTTRWSLTDLETYMPCDLMTKVDIASMAHSLECRCPLLDYRVVELAARMPFSVKVHGRRTKWVLREAFANVLPPEIDRRPKRGFAAPLDRWFRGAWKSLANEVLLDGQMRQRGIFRPDVVASILREHASGQFDHAARIWGLIVLELSLRLTSGDV